MNTAVSTRLTLGQRRELTYAKAPSNNAQPDKGPLPRRQTILRLPPTARRRGHIESCKQGAWASIGSGDGTKIYSFESQQEQSDCHATARLEMLARPIAPTAPCPSFQAARAETRQARYWMHGPPPTARRKNISSKSRSQASHARYAQNFKAVIIILDQQDYLPGLLQIIRYPTNRSSTAIRLQTDLSLHQARNVRTKRTLTDMVKKGLDPFGLIRPYFFNPGTAPRLEKSRAETA